jgi:hypothetical protein
MTTKKVSFPPILLEIVKSYNTLSCFLFGIGKLLTLRQFFLFSIIREKIVKKQSTITYTVNGRVLSLQATLYELRLRYGYFAVFKAHVAN